MIDLRYFKRYRMELELARPLPPVPELPPGYFWLPWDDPLAGAHARAKFASFRGEIDAEIFPSLSTPDGCAQLMRAIRQKQGFLPGATWLVPSWNVTRPANTFRTIATTSSSSNGRRSSEWHIQRPVA